MRIHSIELTRFRGAQELELNFHSNLTVLVGANGAGKSTILDAIAIGLSWLVNRIKRIKASGRPILESDINNAKNNAGILLTLNENKEMYGWGLTKSRKGVLRRGVSVGLESVSVLALQIQEKITRTDGRCNLPLLAYYPVNRAVLDIPLRIRTKHTFEPVDAYEESLAGGASFRTFFEWFRQREDIENENKIIMSGKISRDHQLESVRRALTMFMPDFCNLRVRREPLRMEVEKKGQKITVNQLSDGEKCLMAMIGDIARRLAIANPVLDNPLEGRGIILIDELELHLHPRWQQQIIPHLLETFPRCQFVVSTHSPHVLTNAKPESVFLLSMDSEKGLAVAPAQESYGKTAERILEDIMGLETTRPTKVTEALKTLFVHINNGELEQAKKDAELLQQEIGADPDLVKAGILIKRKELIGK
jgi:predicted ATP-binding protein involved in virulence